MADKTGISWTDATWNPVRGCSRVSEGCRHCYAEQQAARIVRMGKGKPTPYDGLVRIGRIPASGESVSAGAQDDPNWVNGTGVRPFALGAEARWTGKVVLDAKTLAKPLSWRKPRRIFVNSMSDLFHEQLTNEQIAAVFGVMAAAPQHTFQVLTKRARRMREWFAWVVESAVRDGATPAAFCFALGQQRGIGNQPRDVVDRARSAEWPLPNVWIGVSVENQDAADERIPDLLATPAAVRFLSCEPLLGEVDLHAIQIPDAERGLRFSALQHQHDDRFGRSDHVIDWVIAGCESGPGARPCDIAWLRSLRNQCFAAGAPIFVKQAVEHNDGQFWEVEAGGDDVNSIHQGSGSKRKPGGVIELPYLDGVQHAAFPTETA